MEKDEKELEKKVAKRKKVNEPVETKEVQIIKNNNTGLIVLNIILICLLAVGCLYEFYLKDNVFKNDKPVNANVNTYVSGNVPEKKNITITETGLADAVEKVYDAVVVIENYSGTKVVSSGSGFVFKTDDKYGYILTNNHVINGSKDIKVTLEEKENGIIPDIIIDYKNHKLYVEIFVTHKVDDNKKAIVKAKKIQLFKMKMLQ